jgi:hypothetical protein
MKTDELIAALAANAGPAPRAVVARRLAPAMAFGVLASVALALLILGPVDPALPGAALWIKLIYAAALGAAAAWLTGRLSRPAARSIGAAMAVAGVAIAMAWAGLGSLLATEPGGRVSYALGHSWAVCPWAVFGLSLPALAATLWAVRGLAPTRPRATGLAAGLLAGAAGAAGYALACVEPSTLFIAIWYTLGIALCGALGAALGPRVLRW